MRTYTLALSILVHLCAIAAIVITPIVATDMLPEPRRAFDFITVRPVEPPPPPPPPVRGRRSDRPVSRSPEAAPTQAPDTIGREAGIDHFEAEGLGQQDSILPGGGSIGVDAGPGIGDPPPLPAPPRRAAPLRVGGSIQRPQKVREVAPVYPAIAQAARVQGVVILEAEIGEDGRVRNLRVLRSIPLLDQAAIDAVRQWQFTPTLLNGEPVPVVMTVTVAFQLR